MARAALLGLTMLAAPAAAQQPKLPVLAPAPAVPPTVRAGVDLWRAGDWLGAVTIWQPFAVAGDADAMFNMGQASKLGRAVPVDKALARDWYRKAALKGHLPAQANLGILLFQAGEKPEAARWLKAAADRGEMRAQYVLGVAHWNGDGVTRSLSMAYAYLTRASAQGLTEATGALGNLSRSLSPADRSSGAAIATGLAAGNGVPAVVAASPPAGSGTTAADLNRRGLAMVKKPAPRLVETAMVQGGVPSASPPVSPPVSPPMLPPVSPPTPTAPVVRKVELPASEVRAEGLKPAETAKTMAKLVEKPKDADKIRAIEQAKVVEKARTAEKAKTVEALLPVWRVQLGAFGSRAQAQTAWSGIAKKQKAAVGKAKPIYDPGRAIDKLQIGPYKTRAEAKDACVKLAFAGQACFVTEG